jgi:two-component system cell cycle response regulator
MAYKTKMDTNPQGASSKHISKPAIEYIPVPRLERGHTYLVEEGRPKLSLDLFSHEVQEEMPCLLVSHMVPEVLLSNLDEKSQRLMGSVPSIWLSSQLGENCISPTDIGILVDKIVRFIEGNQQSVVLMDGLEYLMVNNDFQKVMKAVSRVNETVMQCDSIMIVPIEPRAFESNELALLERDMEMI